MPVNLDTIFHRFGRGAYAPVYTDGKDGDSLEKSLEHSTSEQRSTSKSSLPSFLKPVLQMFLVVALMLASYAFGAYSSRVPEHSLGFVPDIPFIPTEPTFHDDDDWVGPGENSDKLWADMYRDMSDNKFIKIEDPAAYNTPSGSHDGEGLNYYSISVYHQLHCLAMFRGIAYDASYSYSAHHGRDMQRNRTEQEWWHLGHCFNYIRQAITCTVDTTLEFPPHNHTPGMKHNIRKTGNRQCRDIVVLDRFVEDNKWVNDKFSVEVVT